MSLSDACDTIINLLRTLRQRDAHSAIVRAMLSVSIAMVCERDVALARQRQQLAALRDELRRYTARQVGGFS